MDEKGVMLGVAGKVTIIIPKTEKNLYTSTGSGNRDWAYNVLVSWDASASHMLQPLDVGVFGPVALAYCGTTR
jgi:hypothetical protein